jgi:zinc/manganese transport system permease protein
MNDVNNQPADLSPYDGVILGAGYAGLLVSFHVGLPSGPVIVLFASLFFLGSLLLGARASVRMRLARPVHLRG